MKYYKNNFTRGLSTFMVASLTLSSLPVAAFAQQAPTAPDAVNGPGPCVGICPVGAGDAQDLPGAGVQIPPPPVQSQPLPPPQQVSQQPPAQSPSQEGAPPAYYPVPTAPVVQVPGVQAYPPQGGQLPPQFPVVDPRQAAANEQYAHLFKSLDVPVSPFYTPDPANSCNQYVQWIHQTNRTFFWQQIALESGLAVHLPLQSTIAEGMGVGIGFGALLGGGFGALVGGLGGLIGGWLYGDKHASQIRAEQENDMRKNRIQCIRSAEASESESRYSQQDPRQYQGPAYGRHEPTGADQGQPTAPVPPVYQQPLDAPGAQAPQGGAPVTADQAACAQ